MIRAVTVYCSSSPDAAPAYVAAARAVGEAIARQNWRLVYGGTSLGLMDAVASAARSAGGSVTGITPQSLSGPGVVDARCDELIVTPTMRDRKALLEARGDALLALPGGLGTLEEFFEAVVGRILGHHHKPIVLLNVQGYFNPLLAMIDHGIEHRFIRPRAKSAYFVADSVHQAISHLQSSPPVEPPPAAPSAIE